MAASPEEKQPIVLIDDQAYLREGMTYLGAMGFEENHITTLTSLKSTLEWIRHPEVHPKEASLILNDDLEDGWGNQALDQLQKSDSPLKNAATVIVSGRPIDLPNSPYKTYPQIIGVLQKPFNASSLRELLTHK